MSAPQSYTLWSVHTDWATLKASINPTVKFITESVHCVGPLKHIKSLSYCNTTIEMTQTIINMVGRFSSSLRGEKAYVGGFT